MLDKMASAVEGNLAKTISNHSGQGRVVNPCAMAENASNVSKISHWEVFVPANVSKAAGAAAKQGEGQVSPATSTSQLHYPHQRDGCGCVASTVVSPLWGWNC